MNDNTPSNVVSLGLALIEENSYDDQYSANMVNEPKSPLIDVINPQPRSGKVFYSRVQSIKEQSKDAGSTRIKRRGAAKVGN